jgi:quercetin dioxygenase-like cupin family protein
MEDGNAMGPYALQPGDGWTYDFGIDFTVKVGELGHGRRVAVIEYTTKPDEEPGDHTHQTEDEVFYVLSGRITFTCEGHTFDLETGGLVFLPCGLRHGYTIHSDEARLLAITSPADEHASVGWGGFVADFEREGELKASPRSGD